MNLLCSLVQFVASLAVRSLACSESLRILAQWQSGWWMKLTTVDLLPRLGMRGAEPLFPHIPLLACCLIKHCNDFLLSAKSVTVYTVGDTKYFSLCI
jgi:hypothetical protein